MKNMIIAFFTLLCTLLYSQPTQWTFPATTLSTVNVNASDPRIAMDGSGNVVAVWVENNLVKSNSKLLSGSWGAVATLSNTGGSSPRVVIDANGNATAVWLENGVVKAASKTLIGSWGLTTSLSNTNAASPTIAVDAAGDVIAAWTRSGNVETATKLFGAAWLNHVTITAGGAALPSLAIGGTGSGSTAAVVWHEPLSGINVVKASTKLLSGSWSTPTAISPANVNAGYARVAVDTNGNATAIWFQYNVVGSSYTDVMVQTADRISGSIWTAPLTLSKPGIRNPANLSSGISYDGNSNALAVWTTSFDDEHIYIQSASRSQNDTWSSKPVNILNGNLYAFSQKTHVSNFGNAVSIFMFNNGVDVIIQASESDISGYIDDVWSVPINISQGKNASPWMATSAVGNTLCSAAIWVHSNGTYNSINATTGVKNLVSPPSSLSVTQNVNNFGAFSEYYNTLSWSAPMDPNVVGYVIYRNGQFLQQVGASTLQITDHNRVQNGSVKYGVASINDDDIHSQIVSISFP